MNFEVIGKKSLIHALVELQHGNEGEKKSAISFLVWCIESKDISYKELEEFWISETCTREQLEPFFIQLKEKVMKKKERKKKMGIKKESGGE